MLYHEGSLLFNRCFHWIIFLQYPSRENLTDESIVAFSVYDTDVFHYDFVFLSIFINQYFVPFSVLVNARVKQFICITL